MRAKVSELVMTAAHYKEQRDRLMDEVRRLISSLESVRGNVDGPERCLGGSWYSFDAMLINDLNRATWLIQSMDGWKKGGPQ